MGDCQLDQSEKKTKKKQDENTQAVMIWVKSEASVKAKDLTIYK